MSRVGRGTTTERAVKVVSALWNRLLPSRRNSRTDSQCRVLTYPRYVRSCLAVYNFPKVQSLANNKTEAADAKITKVCVISGLNKGRRRRRRESAGCH